MTTNSRRRTRRRKTAAKKTYRKNRGFTSASARKASKKRWRRAKAGRGRKLRGRALRRGYVYYKGKRPRALRGQKRVRRLPKSRVYLTNRRKRRTSKRRGYSTKRRTTRRRRMRANKGGGIFRFRKNQMRTLFKTSLLVTTGFLGHKALTHVVCNMLVKPMLNKSNGNGGAVSQYGNGGTKNAVAYIATGFGVGLLGVFVAGKVAPKHKYEIGAGMMASWITGSIVALLDMSPGSQAAASYLSGYSSPSRAAAIGRYRRRRGMRGLGSNQLSILPRYVPTDPSMPGGLQQAVASAGVGEYFLPQGNAMQGVGEYFASGVQGIGQYEPAGPMVTQAAAGFGQVIEDGIRPDANMDAVLTLAEAQAGMGSAVGRLASGARFGRRSVGEYYTAGGSGLATVGEHSEWIPNNALWAGTKPAGDSAATSELTAGILETAGGNGIFG
jgi:hypothetical protein